MKRKNQQTTMLAALLLFGAVTMASGVTQKGNPAPQAATPTVVDKPAAAHAKQKAGVADNNPAAAEEKPAATPAKEKAGVSQADSKQLEHEAVNNQAQPAGLFSTSEGEANEQAVPATVSVKAEEVEGLTQAIENVVENHSSSNWLPTLLALAALLLSLYLWKTAGDEKKKAKRQQQAHGSSQRNQRRGETTEEALNTLRNKSKVQENRIAALSEQLTALTEQLNRLPKQQQTVAPVGGGGSHPHNRPAQANAKKYASSVVTDGFPTDSLADANSEYAIAVLTVNGSQGTYIINDLPAAQSYLISNFSYGAGRVCHVANKVATPKAVHTTTPGQIRLEGSVWKIKTMATVSLT